MNHDQATEFVELVRMYGQQLEGADVATIWGGLPVYMLAEFELSDLAYLHQGCDGWASSLDAAVPSPATTRKWRNVTAAQKRAVFKKHGVTAYAVEDAISLLCMGRELHVEHTKELQQVRCIEEEARRRGATEKDIEDLYAFVNGKLDSGMTNLVLEDSVLNQIKANIIRKVYRQGEPGTFIEVARRVVAQPKNAQVFRDLQIDPEEWIQGIEERDEDVTNAMLEKFKDRQAIVDAIKAVESKAFPRRQWPQPPEDEAAQQREREEQARREAERDAQRVRVTAIGSSAVGCWILTLWPESWVQAAPPPMYWSGDPMAFMAAQGFLGPWSFPGQPASDSTPLEQLSQSE